MAHEYKDAAKKAHDKKLASFGGKGKDNDHWAGLKDINTSKQAGMKVIDKEPELSEETAPRIMRKAGGAVKGAQSLKRLDKAPRGKKPVMGGTRVGDIPSPQKEQEDFDPTMRSKKERGGKVSEMEWEHSKKDLEQDKKLAKKHGMSMEKWEKSALDKKHDKQRSTEGLKRGGRAYESTAMNTTPESKSGYDVSNYDEAESARKIHDALRARRSGADSGPISYNDKSYVSGTFGETPRKKGGPIDKRSKRASGGGLGMLDDDHDAPKSHGKKGAGKTTVNIIIGGGPGGQQGAPAPMMGPGALPPMAPPPAPPPGPAMPPPGAMGAPPAGPVGGPPQLPPGLMMRKDGGKVQVPYKKPGRKDGYPAMDFGAGSGFGRKQKIDSYGDK